MVGLKELVRPGMRVVIKPNLLMKRKPEETTTTHPEVVRGVIRLLRSLGVAAENITLADSPGGLYTHAALSGIYTATGMRAVAEQEGSSSTTIIPQSKQLSVAGTLPYLPDYPAGCGS